MSISHHFLTFITIVLCVTFLQVDAFGARRQYHSYHHISQKNRSNTSNRRTTRSRRHTYPPAASSVSSVTVTDTLQPSSSTTNSRGSTSDVGTSDTAAPLTSSSLQDETELLLERAAHIRELNARRREELLSSATPS